MAVDTATWRQPLENFLLQPYAVAGLLVLVVSLLVNIVLRRRAERALRRNEQQARAQLAELENVYRNTPIGLGFVDRELRYVRINDFLAAMNGSTVEEHLGRTPDEVVPGIADRLAPIYRQGIETGLPGLNHEGTGRTAADSEKEHVWQTNYYPLKSGAGTVSGVLTVVTDITARKRVEDEMEQYRLRLEAKVKERMAEVELANLLLQQEIREREQAEESLQISEKLYRALIEKAGDAVFLLEAEEPDVGKIISTNQAAADMHGYSFDELLSLNIRDMDTPEAARSMPDRVRRIMAGEWIKEEISHRKKDGTVFPVEISAGLLEIENRRYILAFDRDITERKRVESDLLQAQKSEALGTLAGGIAHDFNNILGTIIGYAEIIEMFDLPADSLVRPKLAEVIRAAYRAKALVQQILTFSRRGRQEKNSVQLDPIIREVLSFMKAILPPGIDVRYTVFREGATVMADGSQIHQVMMNLCTNAMHAMEKSGGVLSVTLDELKIEPGIYGMMLGLEPGGYSKISVGDTGVGMEPEVMERVFDPYFTTRETGEGTGLGLAVALGIARNHGGTITVQSGVGIGSVFQVFLPRSEPSGSRTLTEPASGVAAGRERVLFVDDEETLAEIGRNILEQCGYQVAVAANGREALRIFQVDPAGFDLVITSTF